MTAKDEVFEVRLNGLRIYFCVAQKHLLCSRNGNDKGTGTVINKISSSETLLLLERNKCIFFRFW